ncbi:MAG: UDP-N-acetylglucosamine 1-carboxyvinyltransferase [Eubacterium sp.]|nr:UDP-N-acetylglucosamine 1-carboxyvinyltransferase [Eubacterium sp.]
MNYLSVKGGTPLCGETGVHGAKNSVLPLLAASVLVKGETVIHNCPRLSDVENTLKILTYIGADVKRNGNDIIINASSVNRNNVPENLMREMRSSIIFLGALSSRLKSSCLFLPGGCEIGLRPIDMHLKGLADLSGVISFDGTNICCNMKCAKASKVVLPFPSFGATENIILASVFLKGTTKIVNAAREPEIADLCNFLNGAGAKISGASTTVIEIEGVEKLNQSEYTVMPDRILASTLMCAAAVTGGEVCIRHISVPELEPVLPVFMEAGCIINLEKNSLVIKSPKRLKRVRKIITRPYPGFPTDCQAPVSAVLCVAKGSSVINETIFENRFKHIPELCRFGADITTDGRTAVINGVKKLSPACAYCTDLRGGAAVVLAALNADGSSEIKNIKHLDRGYENIEIQLSELGADIKRINNEKESVETSETARQA